MRLEPNGPISLPAAQAKFWRAAPLRGAETGVSIPTQGGRNRRGHTKKATPENLLVGSLVRTQRAAASGRKEELATRITQNGLLRLQGVGRARSGVRRLRGGEAFGAHDAHSAGNGAGAHDPPAVFYIYRYARSERIKQLAQKNQKW